MRDVALGFESEDVLLADTEVYWLNYAGREGPVFFHRLKGELEALPEVKEVGYSIYREVTQLHTTSRISLTGAASDEPVEAQFQVVSPGYSQVMRIPVLTGRSFEDRDEREAPWVAILDERLAARHFPGQDPLGREIRLEDEPRPRRIVGVVGAIHFSRLWDTPPPILYIPSGQYPILQATLHVRTAGEPRQAIPSLRRRLHEIEPDAALFNVKMMEDHIAESLSQQRLSAFLATSSAVAGLVIAMMGIYGVFRWRSGVETGNSGFASRSARHPSG